ncbi:hypothetical protein D3C71_1566240 [compost metagenome]
MTFRGPIAGDLVSFDAVRPWHLDFGLTRLANAVITPHFSGCAGYHRDSAAQLSVHPCYGSQSLRVVAPTGQPRRNRVEPRLLPAKHDGQHPPSSNPGRLVTIFKETQTATESGDGLPSGVLDEICGLEQQRFCRRCGRDCGCGKEKSCESQTVQNRDRGRPHVFLH